MRNETLSFNESASAKEDNPIHYSELQDLCDKYYALPNSTIKDKYRKKCTLDEFIELFGTVFGDINHDIEKWLSDDDARRLIRMFKQGGFAFHVQSFFIDINISHIQEVNDYLMDGWSTLASVITNNKYKVIFYKKTNLYKVHQNKNLRELNRKTGIFEKKSSLKNETTIPITSKYSIIFWIDDEYDEKPWNLSIINYDDEMDGLTFACEDIDDNMSVVINDFGLGQDQYMNEEELEILKLLKLEVGQKFKNMQELYTYIQLVLSKKVNGLFKTGIFENLKEKIDLYLKTGYGYDLKQWIMEFGDYFGDTDIHTHRLDIWLSEAECLEIFNMYLHKGYDFLVEAGAINNDILTRRKRGWKVFKMKEFSKYDYDVIFYKENKLFNLMNNVKGLKKTGIFENNEFEDFNNDEVVWKVEKPKGNFQIYLNGYIPAVFGTPSDPRPYQKKVFEILYYGTGWKPAKEENNEWNYITHDTEIEKQQHGEWTEFKTLEEVIVSFVKKGVIIPRKSIEEYKQNIIRAIFGNFIDSEKVMSLNQKTGLLENSLTVISDFYTKARDKAKDDYLMDFVDEFCTQYSDGKYYSISEWIRDDEIKQLIRDFRSKKYDFLIIKESDLSKKKEEGWLVFAMEMRADLEDNTVILCRKNKLHNLFKSKTLKNLNKKTGIFEKISSVISDFSVFEELIVQWKKVYSNCIDIANKHGYEVIQERLDPNYTFKIRVILECVEDEEFNIERFHKLYEEIENMKSVKIDELDKRIHSLCNTDKFDITEIDKSKKLKHLNKTGIFENSEKVLKKINQRFDNLKPYPYIDIYID